MPSPPAVVSSRWKAVAFALSLILVGLVIWDGSDHRAADATKPLEQGAAAKSLQTEPRTLKLASFNIHSGKGRDGIQSLARTAELLSDVDFVGLYEVRATAGRKPPNQAATLAESCQTGWVFAPTERQWWADHFGNALLHRIPVHAVMRIPLINTRGKAYRNAILSTVEIDRKPVRILAVHIDSETDRRQQLQSVIDLFLELEAPCVLMGDLNSSADDPLLISLREHHGVESPLHQMQKEEAVRKSIDWIFTRGLKTVSAKLVDNEASDHPVLKAEFSLKNSPPVE